MEAKTGIEFKVGRWYWFVFINNKGERESKDYLITGQKTFSDWLFDKSYSGWHVEKVMTISL